MSDYVANPPNLTEDSWVGVPSRQRRLHWEALRGMVLARAVDDIITVLRRVRHSRRAVGWRPCRVMELAAAQQDVREIMYLLLDVNVHSDMKLWALERAATGQWRVPSANMDNGTSTRDVALLLLGLEHERGYSAPLEEKERLLDAPCCWEEGMVGSEFSRQTELLCDELVYSFCLTSQIA